MVDLKDVKIGDTVLVGSMGFVVEKIDRDFFLDEYKFHSGRRLLFGASGEIEAFFSGRFVVRGEIVDKVISSVKAA